VRGVIAESHLDLTPVDEVGLLLLVVIVHAGLVSGRQDHSVDPERGDGELSADLAKAIAIAHLIEA